MTEQLYIATQMAKRRSLKSCMYEDRQVNSPAYHNNPSNDMRLYTSTPPANLLSAVKTPSFKYRTASRRRNPRWPFRDNAFDIQQRSQP